MSALLARGHAHAARSSFSVTLGNEAEGRLKRTCVFPQRPRGGLASRGNVKQSDADYLAGFDVSAETFRTTQ